MIHFLVGIDFNENYNRSKEIQRLIESYKEVDYSFDNKLVFSCPENVEIPIDIPYDIKYFKTGSIDIHSKYINIFRSIVDYFQYCEEDDIIVWCEPDMLFLQNDVNIASDKISLLMRHKTEIEVKGLMNINKLQNMFKDIKLDYYTALSGTIIPVKYEDDFTNLLSLEISVLTKYKNTFIKAIGYDFSIEEILLNKLITEDKVISNPYILYYGEDEEMPLITDKMFLCHYYNEKQYEEMKCIK